MEKIIRLITAAAVLLTLTVSMITAPVMAAAEVSADFRNDSMLQEVSKAGVDITLDNTSGGSKKTYDITVTIFDLTAWADGETPAKYTSAQVIKETVGIEGGAKQTLKVDIPRKGYLAVDVKVESDGSTLLNEARELCLIEYYKKQFMDEYSAIGFNAHMEEKEIEAMKKAGILNYRAEISWAGAERSPGVYTFDNIDKTVRLADENGIKTHLLIDYSNEIWVPTPDSDTIQSHRRASFMGAHTKEQVDAFARYAKEVVKRYPTVKTVEIYNEPSFSYWQPHNDYKSLDYATFAKVVSMAIKEVRPDVTVMGGSFAFGGSPTAYRFMDDFFSEGTLDYVDGVAYHPYYGNDPYMTIDAGDAESVENPPYSQWLGGITFIGGKVDEHVYKQGGFKDVYDTETGFHTAPNKAQSTDEIFMEQAKNMVKQFLYEIELGRPLTTVYNFRNSGTDALDGEHNWGVITGDDMPKPSFASVSQLTNVLNGSTFIGDVDLGDPKVKALLFQKDGKPLIAAWTTRTYTTDELYTKTINISNEKAEDMYGNKMDTLTLTNSPMYIYGVSDDYYANSLTTNTQKYYSRLLTQVNNDEISAVLTDILAVNTLPASDTALELLNKNYALGISLAEQYKNGQLNLTSNEFMAALFDIHNAGKQLGHLYSAALVNEGKSLAFSNEAVKTAENKINNKLNKLYYTQMKISEELLRHAKRHSGKAEFLSAPDYYPQNSGKLTNTAFEQLMSEKLSEWASVISDFEEVNDYASVVMYADFEGRPAQNKMDINRGGRKTAEITIDNTKRMRAINNITAVIIDDMGRYLYESPSFNIQSSKIGTVSMEVYVPGDIKPGKHIFKIALLENDKIISQKGLGINVVDTMVSSSSLIDIFTAPWAVDAINKMVGIGVINGMGGNLFRPDNSVTREQFTKMVVEMFGIEIGSQSCSFSDVASGEWYYEYIAAAENAGIIKDRQGYFGVSEPMTRQDMALMIGSALELRIGELSGYEHMFSDNDSIAGYAAKSILSLVGKGVIKGYEDNTFRPLNNSTRAEAAQMLYNVYEAFEFENQ